MSSSVSGESFSNSSTSPSEQHSTPQTRRKHSLEYKFKVIQQYEQSHLTIYQFCKLHSNIKRRNLRRWIVNKSNIQNLYLGFSPTLTRFRTSRFDIIENPLYAWIMDVIHRNNTFPISRSTIVQKAKKLYKKAVFLRKGRNNEDESSSGSISLLELSEEESDNSATVDSASPPVSEVNTKIESKSKQVSNYSPPDPSPPTTISYSGITNPGALCYVTAVLQQLFMHIQFCETILCWDEASEEARHPLDVSPEEVAVVVHSWTAVKSVFFQLDATRNKNSPISLNSFCQSFQTSLGKHLDVDVQEDAEEFLVRLFDIMQRRIHYTLAPDFIDLFFGTQLKNTIVCPHGHLSTTYERCLHLSIDMECDCLEDALRKQTQIQPVSYKCSECHADKPTESYQVSSFANLPNTIIFHLKRFGLNGKNHRMFSFPIRECLDLSGHMAQEVDKYIQSISLDFQKGKHRHSYAREMLFIPTKRKRRGLSRPQDYAQTYLTGEFCRAPSDPISLSDSDDSTESDSQFRSRQRRTGSDLIERFHLVGVITHQGTLNGGHYRSYVKERTEPYRWIRFDDSSVTEISSEKLATIAYGGVRQEESAYILFYERIDPINEWVEC